MNVPNATGLFALKWLTLCYVNFASLKKGGTFSDCPLLNRGGLNLGPSGKERWGRLPNDVNVPNATEHLKMAEKKRWYNLIGLFYHP